MRVLISHLLTKLIEGGQHKMESITTTVKESWRNLKSMNAREVSGKLAWIRCIFALSISHNFLSHHSFPMCQSIHQTLNLAMIILSALMIWKGWFVFFSIFPKVLFDPALCMRFQA
jgi:hypothetical protein